MGLLLQDMDSMVMSAMAIEGEIDDAKSIRHVGTGRRKEGQPSLSSGKRRRTSVSRGLQGQGRGYQGQGQGRGTSQIRPMTCFFCHQPGHIRRDCP